MCENNMKDVLCMWVGARGRERQAEVEAGRVKKRGLPRKSFLISGVED